MTVPQAQSNKFTARELPSELNGILIQVEPDGMVITATYNLPTGNDRVAQEKNIQSRIISAIDNAFNTAPDIDDIYWKAPSPEVSNGKIEFSFAMESK